MASWFVSRVPFRAQRIDVVNAMSTELVRQVPARPARFPVELGTLLGQEEHSVPSTAAPSELTYYLARVNDVSANGDITATIWQIPSGSEAISTLSVDDDLRGERPIPGELLHIRTWKELPGEGKVIPRIDVRREKRTLTDADREALDAALQRVRDRYQ